ncbi:MAG: methyltransferase domain-containing protein [Nitrospinota bacterium]|nr:MAG: methyltransferase domain-containing protein [Nitrospinota bacterium]
MGKDSSYFLTEAEWLTLHHQALSRERRQMVEDFPLQPGDRVLDVACGNGLWEPWLAERVAPGGQIIGVDLSPALLSLAREQNKECAEAVLHWIAADLQALPFSSPWADVLFCANTFQYFPQPVEVLQKLSQIVRRGGRIIIKDVDVAHITFSPLPVDLVERTVLAGIQAAQEQKVGHYHDPFVGRKLPQIFAQAGIRHLQTRTYGVQKVAPFTPLETQFLQTIAKVVIDYAREYLTAQDRTAWQRYFDPHSPQYVLHQPGAYFYTVEVVTIGQV